MAPIVQAVIISDGEVQRSRILKIQVVFTEFLNQDNLHTAFKITRQSDSEEIGCINVAPCGSVVTLRFSKCLTDYGSLQDGEYILTIDHTKIKSVVDGAMMANDYTSQPFYRLFGDSNGDRTVDGTDYGEFGNAYNTTYPNNGYQYHFDFNGDGVIDASDLAEFNSRFGTSM